MRFLNNPLAVRVIPYCTIWINDLFYDNRGMKRNRKERIARHLVSINNTNIAEEVIMTNLNNIAEITTAQNSENNQQEDILNLLEDTSIYQADNLTQPNNVENFVEYLKERIARMESMNAKDKFKNSNILAKMKDGTWRLKFYCGKQPIAFKKRVNKKGLEIIVSQAISCKSFEQAIQRLQAFISQVENDNPTYLAAVEDAIERYNFNMKNEPRLNVRAS